MQVGGASQVVQVDGMGEQRDGSIELLCGQGTFVYLASLKEHFQGKQ